MEANLIWHDWNYPYKPTHETCVLVQSKGEYFLCYWVPDVATFEDRQWGYVTEWEAWAEIPAFVPSVEK